MKSPFKLTLIILALASTISTYAQNSMVTSELVASANSTAISVVTASPKIEKQKAVIITGARFAYPLIQKWIDDYSNANPNAQIVIESRGSADPAQYDILVEAYDQDEEIKKTRDYTNVARYAILPIANSKSAFAKLYADKGLNKDLINQLFFHDIYSEKKDLTVKEIKVPFTIYTRLQKAGAPIVFTKYFGYQQKDIKGKAIAGADEHLLKAVLRDSLGVSYLPLSLIYDQASKKLVAGLTVLPVDLNGNGRVSDDEKFYNDLATVVEKLEGGGIRGGIQNVPLEPLHLSVAKNSASTEALEFLKWIVANGQKDLHAFGFIKPEQSNQGLSNP